MGPLCLWFLGTSLPPSSLSSAHSILLSHVDGPSSVRPFVRPSLRPSVFQPIIRPSVPPFLHDLPPSRPSDPHGDGQTPPPPMNPPSMLFYAV